MKTNQKVRRILFALAGRREFEVQCADPDREFERIGAVAMVVLPGDQHRWYCKDRIGNKLLLTDGHLNAFHDAWEAAEWLVRYVNGELDADERESNTPPAENRTEGWLFPAEATA